MLQYGIIVFAVSISLLNIVLYRKMLSRYKSNEKVFDNILSFQNDVLKLYASLKEKMEENTKDIIEIGIVFQEVVEALSTPPDEKTNYNNREATTTKKKLN